MLNAIENGRISSIECIAEVHEEWERDVTDVAFMLDIIMRTSPQEKVREIELTRIIVPSC